MASSSEPPYLSIGTDVSAKYRGAFCEAKVKKIVKSVKIRVFVKDTQSNVVVTDEDITGPLKIGAAVEIKHPDSGNVVEAVIKHMMDSSMYTVVFDDADERTLRRTQLCLKGDKHFTESETLDNLPLSNPEHFGTPVVAKGKRIRTSAGVTELEESEESTDEEGSPRRRIYRGGNQDLVGKILFFDSGERKKTGTLVPVLVCLPDAHNTELKTKDHLLVKSFKDGKFFAMPRKELVSFTRDAVLKNEEKILKPAMEKALLYIDNSELPLQWNREELIGSEDEDDNDESSEDEEQSEEKDRFVAQLYKFSDDRGTPINKGPCIGSKDLDLFRLFKVVQNLGGYNRVTNQMKWRLVYSKMLLPPSNTASTQIKNAYKKYLHAFEDFYRKLGSSMGTISRPSRSRHGSGRSIMNFRDKEKTSEKTDSEKEKGGDDNKSEFDSDAESVSKQSGGSTPKRPKSARIKLDLKDAKDSSKEEKKEEKYEPKKEEKETKRSEEMSRKSKKILEDKKDKKTETKDESEKKGGKKKDDGTSPVTPRKKDTEDELKDLQKKISRRRSARVDDKNEEEDEDSKKKETKKEETKETRENKRERKEEKKEDVKDKKKEEKEEKKKDMEEKVEKKPRRREVKKKNTQDESDESDSETQQPSTPVHINDLPVGTKMKVKYGRGRNAREYEAKILEVGTEPGPRQYLVHYQGWNNRHDEWIKTDRIVKVLERPEGSKKAHQKPSPKPAPKGPKKKVINEKQPASPSSVKSDASTGRTGKSTKEQTTLQSASSGTAITAPVSKGRPTRSNSIESKISEGLPAKRRMPKAPSINESGHGSDSETSDKSEEAESEKKTEVEEKEETPVTSSSMPSIISKKVEEEEEGMDLDSNLDRSPPKLSKVTDLNKEKCEVEEKVEEMPEKVEAKEEPIAPVLKVENDKNSEPILQKIEAQLNSSSAAVKVSGSVIEEKEQDLKKSEEKEKDPKKKEMDRKVKKIVKDTDKSEVGNFPKRIENTVKDNSAELLEKDLSDEIDDKTVDKDSSETQERKKQVVVLPQVMQKTALELSENTQDDSTVLIKKPMEETGKNIRPSVIISDKETAKSDSEVERRGRKKKVANKDESQKDVKKPKIGNLEKKILDAPNLIEKRNFNSPYERKPFITLAEKKQGFSPIVRKIPVNASEKVLEPLSAPDNALSEDLLSMDKDETKKGTDMVVIHKESPIKSDIVVGRRTEISSMEDEHYIKHEDEQVKDEEEESINDPQVVRKKVRKKTKKKGEIDETVTKKTVKTRALSNKGKEPVRKIRDAQHRFSDTESAIKDSTIDIDLRCEESIRSRSASPEPVINNSSVTIHESQGFEFFVETVTSHLHASQSSTSGLSLRDEKSKSVKNNVFENTPPTTPEHDSDEASQLNSQNDQIKANEKGSNRYRELGSKPDSSHQEGNESPRGNASPASNGSGGSSGVIGGSEGSVDVPVHNNKRRRESEENTPSKRRKRASRGKAAANRARQMAVESDTDEASNMSAKCRSPHYTSDSYPSKTPQNTSRSPRPLKYNFNLEEGKYLEGNARISFLIDKIQEIRKIYMNLKSEVASIDRRRKKLRRREKESASSSAVEVECS